MQITNFTNHKNEIKFIIINIFLFSLLLMLGIAGKDIVPITITVLILLLLSTKHYFASFYIFIIWSSLYGFFVGQGFFDYEISYKYITKPYMILFVFFLFFLFKEKIRIKKYYKYVCIYACFAISSLLYNDQSIFTTITLISFFIAGPVAELCVVRDADKEKIIILIISIAIFQVIISYLQLKGIISPQIKLMDDGKGSQNLWNPGLDDAACGTFGAGLSHLTTLYNTIVAIFLIARYLVVKRNFYLQLAFVILLQHVLADSKTITILTIFTFIFLLFFATYKSYIIKFNLVRLLTIYFYIILGIIFIIFASDQYYKYQNYEKKSTRPDLQTVIEREIAPSLEGVVKNWKDWGKIRGFSYIAQDFIHQDIGKFLVGYGPQGYTLNGKMGFIWSKDTHLMSKNNFLNSNSGLITVFATLGTLGFLSYIASIFNWYSYNNGSYCKKTNNLKSIFVPVSFFLFLITSFLYSVNVESIPLVLYSILAVMSDT